MGRAQHNPVSRTCVQVRLAAAQPQWRSSNGDGPRERAARGPHGGVIYVNAPTEVLEI